MTKGLNAKKVFLGIQKYFCFHDFSPRHHNWLRKTFSTGKSFCGMQASFQREERTGQHSTNVPKG